MEMRRLRHFLAAVEHGNMLRAAEAVHISQPALTKSIQNLEAELDVPLLVRGPRGVTPTIYGEILVGHAALLRNGVEQAVAEIRAVKEGRAGHLRLGVANFAIDFLPRAVAGLLQDTPGLTLEVVDGTYEGLTAALREGALDAVVSGFPPLHQASDLVHEPLVAGEFLLVCRSGHPLAARRQPTLADAAAERWVLANRPQAIVDLVELAFRRAGLAPPELVLQSGSMLFLEAVVLQSDLLTLLPRGVVAEELESGRLVALPVTGFTATTTTEGVIYRADALRPPALDRLIEAIKTERDRPRSRVATTPRRGGARRDV